MPKRSHTFVSTLFVFLFFGMFSFAAASLLPLESTVVGKLFGITTDDLGPSKSTDKRPANNLVQANQYFAGDGSSLTSSTSWGTNPTGPFNAAFISGNIANFAVTNGTGTGGSITIAGMNATENLTITSASGTISNVSNGVVPVNVSTGKILDFGAQAFTSSTTAGYNFTGPGVFALSGGPYGGGFTINSGTLVARGVNAMGGTSANTLTINGGTIAANTSQTFTGKFGGGISVSNNFQLGELSSNVAISSDAANLTFNNNMGIGSATRTITIGANGTYSLSGVISGAVGSGLTVNNAAGATGTLLLSGSNTFTGPVTISGGSLSISTISNGGIAGPLGASTNAASNLVFDGGILKYTGGSDGSTNRSFTINNGKTAVIDVPSGVNLTISGAAAATNGGLTKTGPGALTLSGTNLYTGNTTITGGSIALLSNATIANSSLIEIAGGGFFDIGSVTNFTLASNQILKASGTTTAGTISTTSGRGLTTASNTQIQFTAYNGVNAPLTIQGSGFVNLASTNSVVVNTTAALGIGDHVLISKGSGSVTGSVPTNLTIGGIGLAAGTIATLQISNAQLVLHVVASPGSIQLSAATYFGAENGGPITVTLNRTGGTNGAVSATVTVGSGTATGGSVCSTGVDFISSVGSVNWPDGDSTAKTVNVTLCDDTIYEGDEDLNVTLSNPTGGATMGTPSSATVTITDNETPNTVWTVTKIADTNDGVCDADCSLREAISAANNTDTIVFSSLFNTPQTITLNGTTELSISKNLKITGPGANLLTINAGDNTASSARIFTIQNTGVNLSGMKLTGGKAGGSVGLGFGGAVYAANSNINLTGMFITGNTSVGGYGGGIDIEGGNLLLTNSTVSGNLASLCGGIRISNAATAQINNTTISGNGDGTFPGGGLCQSSTGQVSVTSSTITGNQSGTTGGGVYVEAGPLFIANSIIAGNFAPNAREFQINLSSTVASQGFNLIGDSPGDAEAYGQGAILIQPTDIIDQNPLLGSLADNGGETPTHKLLALSPAIDAGSAFGNTSDQRGLPRPIDQASKSNAGGGDGSDIGAFEVQTLTAAPVSLSGRVADASGRGISGVTVTISGGKLDTAMSVKTNSFGYYSFEGLEPSETYIVSAQARRYVISDPVRVVSLVDDLADFDFTAEPR